MGFDLVVDEALVRDLDWEDLWLLVLAPWSGDQRRGSSFVGGVGAVAMACLHCVILLEINCPVHPLLRATQSPCLPFMHSP